MRIPLALATLVTPALLALTPTPAQAATPCPGPTATQLEVDRLQIGMRAVQVFAIIGSAGTYDAPGSTPEIATRQWVYCYPDGTLQGRQGVRFEQAPAGYWIVHEVL